MITLIKLKEIINLLNKNNITYWVFGGFALDGIRGKISREHEDVDIYLHLRDLDKILELFNSKQTQCLKRENMHFIKSSKLKIGIVTLTEEEESFTAHGNKTLAIYPKKMFSKDHYGKLNGITFRIAPFEVLALESRFSRFEKDKSFGSELKYDKRLFKEIKTQKVRDSKNL